LAGFLLSQFRFAAYQSEPAQVSPMAARDVSEGTASPNILWSVVDGEAVLLDTASGNYFSMNPIATDLWERLQQGASVDQVVAMVADKYRVGEATVRGDLEEFIGELRRSGILNHDQVDQHAERQQSA
jgi:hypothetical protein